MSIQDRNLKPGTVLVARYKKAQHRCEVIAGEDGKVAFRIKGGKAFTSPSAAGSAVMGGVACNGWRFWSVEGEAKAATRATSANKRAAKGKATPKPKGRAKRAAKAKKAGKVAGGANGAEPPAEQPMACGECSEQFPSSLEAGDHMRDAHGSPEAAGSGGR
jgi:hypothetical protein